MDINGLSCKLDNPTETTSVNFFLHGFLSDLEQYSKKALFKDVNSVFNEEYDEKFSEFKSFKTYPELNSYLNQVIERKEIGSTIEEQDLGNKNVEIVPPLVKKKSSKILELLKLNSNTKLAKTDQIPLNEIKNTDKKTLIVANILTTLRHGEKEYILDTVNFDDELQRSFLGIENYRSANDFIDTYGTHFLFGKVTLRKLVINCVQISSESTTYETLHEIGLKVLTKSYLKSIRSDPNTEYRYKISGKKYNLMFSNKSLDTVVKFKKSENMDYHSDPNIQWLTIVQALTNIQWFNQFPIKMLRISDVFNLRKFSKHYKEASKIILQACLEPCKQFNFDVYWEYCIHRPTKLFYETRYGMHYDHDVPGNVEQDIFLHMSMLAESDISLICELAKFDVLYLTYKLDYFLKMNKDKYNIILFYYSRKLRYDKPDMWDACIKGFTSSIYTRKIRDDCNTKPVLGVLVDYDIHTYLEDQIPFFDKTIKLEMCFKIEGGKCVDRCLDLRCQDRVEINDVETLENIDKLDLTNNLIRKMDFFTFTQTPFYHYLIEIDLKRNCIEYIGPKTFVNFRFLEKLDLSSNFLKRISNEMFKNLKGLVSLDLSRNQIYEIQQESFRTLVNLKKLDLSSNNMEFLPDGDECLFLNLKNLEVLDLSRNKFWMMKLGLFDGLNSVRELDLSWNLIHEIKPSSFSSLKSLEVLNLSHNAILSLAECLFGDLKNLRVFCLNGNMLKSFDNMILKGLCKLEVLLLHSNSLTFIEKDTLNNMLSVGKGSDKFKLRVLTLYDNYFSRGLNLSELISHVNLASLRYVLEEYDSEKVKEICMLKKFKRYRSLIKNQIVSNQ